MDKQSWFLLSLGAFVTMGIVQLLDLVLMSLMTTSSPWQPMRLHVEQWNFGICSALSLGAGLIAYPQRRLQTLWILPCGIYLARALALSLPHS